jgi:hypothetical protein
MGYADKRGIFFPHDLCPTGRRSGTGAHGRGDAETLDCSWAELSLVSDFLQELVVEAAPLAASIWNRLAQHGSKRHRHEETIDARLAVTPPAVCPRRSILIPIENPIITVLARERQGDGDGTMISVDTVVIAIPMDLVGCQMMRVRRTAARSFHPIGDWRAVCPLVVSARRDRGQRSEDRNQTPHAASGAIRVQLDAHRRLP